MVNNWSQNAQKTSEMVKKIRVFSDKDFLDWPAPPPLLTESKKEQVFYASPKSEITIVQNREL